MERVERIELSAPAARTLYFTRVDDLAEYQSSPISSPKAGIDCPKLAEVVSVWASLSDEIKGAIHSIVKASKVEGGQGE